MPRRQDLKHVLVIGSGPILIGQAAEFDYSGTQACRVLKAEGLRVTLINSNPATIMTDPEFADATYIEPITTEFVTKVIEKERPDALLPTLGGQTALNCAMALHEAGILEQYGVELIGADVDAIRRGEDRQAFKDVVETIGAESARSAVCHTMEELLAAARDLGYPVVVRPSFTMGGAGGGIAFDEDGLRRIGGGGLHASATTEVLLEESILGWKEYELELMRDKNDNVVVICSIENLDPLGVHTGDSITVAPAMTLTDREYQKLRDISIDVIREVGVDTGGCNIQFAVNPADGRVVVIEMNPRVDAGGLEDLVLRRAGPDRVHHELDAAVVRARDLLEQGRLVARVAGPREGGLLALQRAHRLAERLGEVATDRHRLADRLHVGRQGRVGVGELLEREPRHLDHHVVQRGLEAGRRLLGDVVGDLVQGVADCHLGGD
ncbi:MAG: carbamoyl-phosphate synthase, large subunit, partial [Frankiales bacterium]|nr:carbamoyl-phosphate synthase, large subunit [Frankiales bacterium]